MSSMKRDSFRQKDVPSAKEESPLKKHTTIPKTVGVDSDRGKSVISPPKRETIPRNKEGSPPKISQVVSLTETNVSKMTSACDEKKEVSRKMLITSPPSSEVSNSSKIGSSLSIEDTVISSKLNASPPILVPKLSKTENGSVTKLPKRENSVCREGPLKAEKLSLIANDVGVTVDKNEEDVCDLNNTRSEFEQQKGEEWNGVGDKIKIFEKVASEAGNGGGRVSRSGSIRVRVRSDRAITEIEEDLPPATPFKDNEKFDIPSVSNDRSLTSVANNSVNTLAARWQRNEVSADIDRPRPEPQKIIKPEFKTISSPADVTIRSPSLGAKIADRFPSYGTAFRNVASPDTSRSRDTLKCDEESAANDFRTCKFRNKERHSTGKSGGYYTRGSEEIWLVKKKDIEEIEERVLDSFRRAGGGCGRSDANRSSQEQAQAPSASGRRHAYARSESHDPTWAGARAHTLKRQTSVACTCGHDRKTRARTLQADPSVRPRSRSHGDDTEQPQVLDKYETLV